LLIAVQGGLSLACGDEAKVLRTGGPAETMMIVGARVTSVQVTSVAVCAVLCLFMWIMLDHTVFGRAVRALASDMDLAVTLGINTDGVLLHSTVIGSALVSCGGVCAAFDTGLSPMMGLDMLMLGVISAVVGGASSVPGIMLGGALIGVARHLGVWKLPTQWQDAITFAILLTFLLLRPQGFFGRKAKKAAL